MKPRLIASALLSFATLAAGSASAQSVRPGLWQTHISTPGKTQEVNPMIGYVARMKKEMATMDPETRKEMEEMLAQLAASESGFTADGYRTKACITKAQASNVGRFIRRDEKGSDNCKRTTSPIVAGQMKINTVCTQPASTSSAIVRFQGETGYSFDGSYTMNDAQGKPITYKSSGWGKWLGSDCGKVQPGEADE